MKDGLDGWLTKLSLPKSDDGRDVTNMALMFVKQQINCEMMGYDWMAGFGL